MEAAHGQANASIAFSGDRLSSGVYAVHALAFLAGAHASQNVSINIVGGALGALAPPALAHNV